MTTAPSSKSRPRRNEEMKFTYAGPFVTLLSPILPVKPERGPSGIVFSRQPRYTPTSAESWTIGARFPAIAGALEALFGREYGSVLDEKESAPLHDQLASAMRVLGRDKSLDPPTAKPKRRRRGSRGGRKPVTS